MAPCTSAHVWQPWLMQGTFTVRMSVAEMLRFGRRYNWDKGSDAYTKGDGYAQIALSTEARPCYPATSVPCCDDVASHADSKSYLASALYLAVCARCMLHSVLGPHGLNQPFVSN